MRARQEIDVIFGQKFHPGFPRAIKSCDTNGCGYYPSTVSGAYNAGIDVVVSPLTSVPSPLSAYVQRLNVRYIFSLYIQHTNIKMYHCYYYYLVLFIYSLFVYLFPSQHLAGFLPESLFQFQI